MCNEHFETKNHPQDISVIQEVCKATEHDLSDIPVIDPVAAYKAVESGVVRAYQAVENGAVSAYQKVEDTMVDKLFRKEGETVEQAKARLRKHS